MTTINKAAASVLRQAQYFVTALHQPAQAVGLSYHGSRNIHSLIANADIQAFRIANSEEQEQMKICFL